MFLRHSARLREGYADVVLEQEQTHYDRSRNRKQQQDQLADAGQAGIHRHYRGGVQGREEGARSRRLAQGLLHQVQVLIGGLHASSSVASTQLTPTLARGSVPKQRSEGGRWEIALGGSTGFVSLLLRKGLGACGCFRSHKHLNRSRLLSRLRERLCAVAIAWIMSVNACVSCTSAHVCVICSPLRACAVSQLALPGACP
eukprot:2220830-Rhodomonas_salina.3